MIRVLIVHQTQLIRSIIANVLDEEPDIQVIGHCANYDETLHTLKHQRCEIVLVASNLPDNGALRITETINEQDRTTKVLVIGLPDSKNAILQYVAAGASGYVLQEVATEKLLEHVRAAHEDKALVSPDIAAALMEHISKLAQLSSQSDIDPAAYSELTPREREVLGLIGKDYSNRQIAEELVIEVGTVKNHVHSILKKLDVSNRHEAASLLPYVEDEEAGDIPGAVTELGS